MRLEYVDQVSRCSQCPGSLRIAAECGRLAQTGEPNLLQLDVDDLP
jgi:hypothetical protein